MCGCFRTSEMAQQIKELAMQACLPKMALWDPCESTRRDMILQSCPLTSTYMCGDTYTSCAHTIILILIKLFLKEQVTGEVTHVFNLSTQDAEAGDSF